MSCTNNCTQVCLVNGIKKKNYIIFSDHTIIRFERIKLIGSAQIDFERLMHMPVMFFEMFTHKLFPWRSSSPLHLLKTFYSGTNIIMPENRRAAAPAQSWRRICFLCLEGVDRKPNLCGEVATGNVTQVTSSECCNLTTVFLRVVCYTTRYWKK